MHYIHDALEQILSETDSPEQTKIIDIGAGTGRYSVALAEEGFDVTAVELVKYNLGILKKKNSTVKAYQGNALKLKKFADGSFDLSLLFGPMYHLYSFEEKLRALSEAKRVTKKDGFIFVAYCMNEFCVLTHGFRENFIKESLAAGKLDETFQSVSTEEDLYSYVRIEEIDALKEGAELERVKLISADGPANYMRPVLNAMDEETYALFLRYHLATCEREELLGAAAHTVDILRKR
ncbi:MAG: class I SAM-dependent methyltransferase [Lachnospiraceae bacterium]|nr:class I SAM-dependent methyltransferase [Lachnospiraceae bacterium]